MKLRNGLPKIFLSTVRHLEWLEYNMCYELPLQWTHQQNYGVKSRKLLKVNSTLLLIVFTGPIDTVISQSIDFVCGEKSQPRWSLFILLSSCWTGTDPLWRRGSGTTDQAQSGHVRSDFNIKSCWKCDLFFFFFNIVVKDPLHLICADRKFSFWWNQCHC